MTIRNLFSQAVVRAASTLLLAGLASGVQAEMIRFENFAPADGSVSVGYLVGPEYVESGYIFGTSLAAVISSTNAYSSSFAAPSTSDFFSYCLLCTEMPTLSLSRIDGQLFSLNGFDVSSGPTSTPSIRLTGVRADDSIVTYDITGHSSHKWLTFVLQPSSGFVNLKSVTISAPYMMVGGLDNIDVSQVPVPAAAWLFGTGLAGLAAARRRKSIVV